jgi:hypothetical protein
LSSSFVICIIQNANCTDWKQEHLEPDFDQGIQLVFFNFSIQNLNGELIFIKDGCRHFICPSPFFLRPFFQPAIYSKIIKTPSIK